VRLALAALCWSAFSLSGPGCDDPVVESEVVPQELQVCKFAGETICGVNQAGDDALLLCEVTQEHGRVWMVQEVCPAGCEAKACKEVVDGSDLRGLETREEEIVEDLAAEDEGPVCVPECEGKSCGDDGCGESCALCPPDHKCGDDFECHLHCEPVCQGKQCGDDGCDGSCGDCPFGMQCMDGLCACNPQCQAKECGPDGCGGQCGECAADAQCSPFGKCEGVCIPACEGKQCGDDGCGAICGACPVGLYCSPEGQCTDQCYPDCEGRECGPDGCFGYCGFCPCPTCILEATECSSEGICVVPEQGLGCSGLLDCLAECPDGDTLCQGACFDQTTLGGQEKYDDLVDCIIAECTAFPTDQCIQDSLLGFCNTVYMDCILDV